MGRSACHGGARWAGRPAPDWWAAARVLYRFRVRAIRRFTVRPVLPEPLRPLEELVLNLRWSWHPETQDLFAAVDAEAWGASGRDPVRFLGAVRSERLNELGKDKKFIRRLELVHADLEAYLTGDQWYQGLGADVPKSIGYFSSIL